MELVVKSNTVIDKRNKAAISDSRLEMFRNILLLNQLISV